MDRDRTDASAAYIASVSNSGIIVDLQSSIQEYNSHVNEASQLTLDNSHPRRQADLSAAIEQKSAKTMLDNADSPSERVRLLEVSSAHAASGRNPRPGDGT